MTTTAPRPPLDLRDGNVLKGIGILLIVLHNYFHLLPEAATENEFGFRPERFPYFLSVVMDPTQTIQEFFSYLGHFGVQLFIFLSAYGLAIKHWRTPSWGGFVWSRIKKIYPTWFLALGLYLVLRLVQDGPAELAEFLGKQGDALVFTTLGIINLLPGYGLPPVGPWWFLPFIIQFYCLWVLLAGFARRFGAVGLFTLAVIGLGVTVAGNEAMRGRYDATLLTTPLGHLPELCLGVAYARFGARAGSVAALAAVIFVLGNLDVLLWPLTYISILVLMLWAYSRTAGWLRERRALVWLGEISMPLFFINGFLRGPFWPLGRAGVWYLELAGGLAFLVVSVGVASLLWRAERWLTGLPRARRHPAPESSV